MKTFIVKAPVRGYEKEFEAIDAEEAAKEFAKEYNEEGDYSLINNSMYVLVSEINEEDEEETPEIFSISAEPDIYYNSDLIEEPVSCKQCGKDCRELILKGEIDELYDDRFCDQKCYFEWYNKKED